MKRYYLIGVLIFFSIILSGCGNRVPAERILLQIDVSEDIENRNEIIADIYEDLKPLHLLEIPLKKYKLEVNNNLSERERNRATEEYLACTEEDIYSGNYLEELIRYYIDLPTREVWKKYACFTWLTREVPDADDVRSFLRDERHKSVLSMFSAYFFTVSRTEEEVRLSKSIAELFGKYIIDNYGLEVLLNCSSDEYINEWLSSLGITYKVAEGSFTEMMEHYIPREEAKIHIYGEMHGLEEYYDVEIEIWSWFYAKGCRDLFIEYPYYTAEFLNLWMKAEDDEILYQICRDAAGTVAGESEANLVFMKTLKRDFPETVFHGTDVGHQYNSTGKRYLEYLKNEGLKDTEKYVLASECRKQGIQFYDQYSSYYRETKMAENFIAEFERIGEKEIVGFYGGAHADYISNDRSMAGMIKDKYGDLLESMCIYDFMDLHNKP
ncbi:MAG: hypothetical protein II694_01340 [Lachnospiraceae bacterium]|jgi:hypothetical protein|nr:hypothetical protein [Lachnospiraceae bacterium]